MSDQVLVTGISGFIAKHVAFVLLRQGYKVRGTLRAMATSEAVRDGLKHAGADVSRLNFVEADLTSDNGWSDAVAGCRFVHHIASPFPLQSPKDREALVPAAREGSLRVLRAALAANVERIVLTSSIVAMMYRKENRGTYVVHEASWTDPDWNALSAYIVSKTRAERAAWDFVSGAAAIERLSVVNPGLVLGPSIDSAVGASLEVVELLLNGAYPALPPVAFPVVDVRDVAELHVRAMITPEAGGRRLMAAADSASMQDIAKVLRGALGEKARKVPTLVLPEFMVRLVAAFDPALRALVPSLGSRPEADSAYVTELTGVSFRPAREAVKASADCLVALGKIR